MFHIVHWLKRICMFTYNCDVYHRTDEWPVQHFNFDDCEKIHVECFTVLTIIRINVSKFGFAHAPILQSKMRSPTRIEFNGNSSRLCRVSNIFSRILFPTFFLLSMKMVWQRKLPSYILYISFDLPDERKFNVMTFLCWKKHTKWTNFSYFKIDNLFSCCFNQIEHKYYTQIISA